MSSSPLGPSSLWHPDHLDSNANPADIAKALQRLDVEIQLYETQLNTAPSGKLWTHEQLAKRVKTKRRPVHPPKLTAVQKLAIEIQILEEECNGNNYDPRSDEYSRQMQLQSVCQQKRDEYNRLTTPG